MLWNGLPYFIFFLMSCAHTGMHPGTRDSRALLLERPPPTKEGRKVGFQICWRVNNVFCHLDEMIMKALGAWSEIRRQ
jgi:hypothetical protein